MGSLYQEFINGLQEERLRIGITQTEMGQLLRMSQSHYSKVELGKRRLTYYEMQFLCETSLDVFYIFTGYRVNLYEKSVLFEYSYEKLVCCLRCLWILLLYSDKRNNMIILKTEKRGFDTEQYTIIECDDVREIFYKLRRNLGYNQAKMADLLGVDVKKLRCLEKGKILPDCELICKLVENFEIPYAIFFKDRRGIICEIIYLLEIFDEKKKKEILYKIDSLLKEF